MTSVLHTADVHLRSDAPERFDALDRVLETADSGNYDVFTVGGDLFDRPEDVESIRTDLRNDLFSNRPFDIVLIPGNHDVDAFRDDVFFGDSVTVLMAEPFEHWTAPSGELRITGVPYVDRPSNELFLALGDREPFDGTEICLLHCSLDAPFDGQATGDEDQHRYFPVTEDILGELGFDYYLAGHYHTPHKVTVSNGAEFAYPGTPASTRSTETSQRRVCTLDTDDGIGFESITSFHYASETFQVTPGSEDEVIRAVDRWVDRHVRSSTEASIDIEGFIDVNEEEFDTRLSEAVGDIDYTNDTRTAGQLLAHPIYRSFEEELEGADWDDETKAAVIDLTLEVFSRLASGGDL